MSDLLSTAFAAHAWLIANVPTATGLETFDRVVLGEELPDSFVVVGKITNLHQQWAGFGNDRADEEYTITGFVRVYTGDDPNTAEAETLASQAWGYIHNIVQLISKVETVNGVQGDETLGGNVFYAHLETANELDIGATNTGGLEIGVEFTIACRAQVYK